MKEIKSQEKIYLQNYEIEVVPYLTYTQIQQIINAVIKFDSWSERQQNIDLLLLYHTTNISTEEIEKYGHSLLLESGLIDAVKNVVKNLNQVYEGINYTESTQRSLTQIVKILTEKFNGLEKRNKIVSSKK